MSTDFPQPVFRKSTAAILIQQYTQTITEFYEICAHGKQGCYGVIQLNGAQITWSMQINKLLKNLQNPGVAPWFIHRATLFNSTK